MCAYNRTTDKVDKFLANEAKGTKIVGAHSIEELCAKLKKPRRVMMLVKAGKPVDDFIEQLLPHMEKGDIIIDGGNSEYNDSIRRAIELEKKGFLYVGTGQCTLPTCCWSRIVMLTRLATRASSLIICLTLKKVDDV